MSSHPSRWSLPIEELLDSRPATQVAPACDVLVIGSGYGGSFAARELADGATDVWVVERGREYALGEFPEDLGALPGHVRVQRGDSEAPTGGVQALMDYRVHDQVAVLVANGLGGGSLINAGVARKPDPDTLGSGAWPAAYRPGGAQHGALCAAMDEVVAALGAAPLPDARQLPKFEALQRLGEAMGAGPPERLALTVAGSDGVSSAGIAMAGCTRCGNCFTGCNVGAKGSLPTSIIPAAVARGARFYTGAMALSVQPLAQGRDSPRGRPLRWRVLLQSTGSGPNTPARQFALEAHTLILGAGTLGSTELLLRSHTVTSSTALGSRFSTNGDTIAMGWRQRRNVDAVSAPSVMDTRPSVGIGPTITATLRKRIVVDGVPQEVLVQDGAVPSALAQTARLLGASLSTLHRYTGDVSARFEGSADPLAVPDDATRRMQLLLVMGQDAADGRISLRPAVGEGRRSTLDVGWPSTSSQGGKAAYYEAVHEALKEGHARGGFDGGDYLASPLWSPAPDGFGEIAAGSQPRRALSVHPLGGCPMGDHGGHAVVDWRGQVFTGEGPAVHPGLHVLDGSVVPAALGVNPLVTISAIALVAARAIAADLHRLVPPTAGTSVGLAAGAAAAVPQQQPRVAAVTPPGVVQTALTLRFHEHLLSAGTGAALPGWVLQMLRAHDLALTEAVASQPRALIVSVEVTLDLHLWLQDPSTRWPARMRIHPNPYPDWATVRPEALAGVPLLEGVGTVSLLALDEPSNMLGRGARMLRAFGAYLKRRGASFSVGGDWWEGAKGYARACYLHTHYRLLDYSFELHAPASAARALPPVRAQGRKRLAYRCDERLPWDALTTLDLALSTPGNPDWRTRYAVDLADMVKRLRLQVSQAPHTPAAIIGLASFAGLWLRAILQTHFWSLRGLDYDKFTPLEPAQPGPLVPEGQGTPVAPETLVFDVPRGHGLPGKIQLRLTRYVPPEAGRAILLVHGLAHGSGVFATDTVAVNMVSHFMGRGYTVWLLDNRMSNALGHAAELHTMDDIARHDIPAAVRRVYEHSGRRPIDVFAHCVGAGATAMAILRTPRADASEALDPRWIRSLIIHAVHPWLVPSATNRFSGALAGLYKDWIGNDQVVEPRMPLAPGLMDELLDRLGATLSWPDGDRARHEADRDDVHAGCAVCNRMTLFYGREWNHGNLDPRTHRRLASLVGPAGLEVFRQLYFLVLRERLTNRDGENIYLRNHHLVDRWTFPTLFVHGTDNQVFDPRGAARSWNRLRRLFGPLGDRPVRLFLKRGYGHMDFLFGKDAARDIYPVLSEFLASPALFADRTDGCHVDPDADLPAGLSSNDDYADREYETPVRPLTGPMLQIERSPEGRRQLVVWVEQTFDTSGRPVAPQMLVDGQVLASARIYAPTATSRLSDLTQARPDAVLRGKGAYWTLVLEEGPGLDFATLPPLTLLLRCEAPAPVFAAGRQAEEAASEGRFRGAKSRTGTWSMATHTAVRADDPRRSSPYQATPAVPQVQAERAVQASSAGLPRPESEAAMAVVLDLRDEPWWRRWTWEPARDSAQVLSAPAVSFLATSCRWPGLAFEQDAVDAMAAAMEPHIDDPALPVDALVLLGDQIYADATANVAETNERSERGAQRYRGSWGAPATQRLFARLPTWLVLDDHEFGDNVDGAAFADVDSAQGRDFHTGFNAAVAYQARYHRHVPRLRRDGQRWRVDRGFWHAFEIGGIPAFAMDTRTERQRRHAADWRSAWLIGDEQLDALKSWMVEHRGEPKLVCSGSVFGVAETRYVNAPATCIDADSWCGYPRTWRDLVQFIVGEQLEHIVFLSGDYHLSLMAELELRSDAGSVRALSVACSAWNATLPFANSEARDFDPGQSIVQPWSDGQASIVSRTSIATTEQRQFSKISVHRGGADAQGLLVEMRTYAGEGGQAVGVPLVGRLHRHESVALGGVS